MLGGADADSTGAAVGSADKLKAEVCMRVCTSIFNPIAKPDEAYTQLRPAVGWDHLHTCPTYGPSPNSPNANSALP